MRNPVSKGEKWGKTPVLVTLYCCDKTSRQRQLIKGFIWGRGLQRISPIMAGNYGSRWQTWRLKQLSTHVSNHKEEAESTLKWLKACAQWHTSSSKARPSNPPPNSCQRGTKYSDAWEYRGISHHQNTPDCPMAPTYLHVHLYSPDTYAPVHLHKHTCTYKLALQNRRFKWTHCCRFPSF